MVYTRYSTSVLKACTLREILASTKSGNLIITTTYVGELKIATTRTRKFRPHPRALDFVFRVGVTSNEARVKISAPTSKKRREDVLDQRIKLVLASPARRIRVRVSCRPLLWAVRAAATGGYVITPRVRVYSPRKTLLQGSAVVVGEDGCGVKMRTHGLKPGDGSYMPP